VEGFGVEEREPLQGDIDSTAVVRYDFSGLSALFSAVGSIPSAWWVGLTAAPCLSVQWEAVVDFNRLSGRYFGTFLAC
jgi:hypothetical protein